MGTLHRIVDRFLKSTGLQYWPVRVKDGMAAGARWTLYPSTSYWRGDFETDLQTAMIRLGPLDGECCWDLGAHFGFFTVGLAKAVGPSGQVGSFEPNPPSSARCQRHLRMNGLSWVRHWTAAVSEFSGKQDLICPNNVGGTSSHLAYEGEYDTTTATISVTKVRLDDLVASGELRLPRLVKIDVEGHAAPALRGAREAIAASRPAMFIAFHSPQEIAGVREALEPLGYRPAWLDGKPCSWDDIECGGTRLFTAD